MLPSISKHGGCSVGGAMAVGKIDHVTVTITLVMMADNMTK